MITGLNIADTFTTDLPADKREENYRRQVWEACFSYVQPKQPSNPSLIAVSDEVAGILGIEITKENKEHWTNILTGADSVENFRAYAQCYGGHQFGHWAGQLGDGRAINIAEVQRDGKQWVMQLKGAGPTPYSRSADGLAVLRSSIREYLCSEAMFHLGVPTTRALSLSLSGDTVIRDMLYDGNPAPEKGAIVCRVAESFLRFGNYQIFLARKDHENLKKLVDYTLKHHFPQFGEGSKESYLALLQEVSNRTLDMIIHWQRVGFVHGVMNTDNMSILGQTIDYGPYGWLEGYDHGWTPNTTDSQHRRYRYGQQASIGLWNLAQLASAFHPLIDDIKAVESILESYRTRFKNKYLEMMMAKLGLQQKEESDGLLIQQLQEVLHRTETDMTIFYQELSKITKETDIKEEDHCLAILNKAFYKPEEVKGIVKNAWIAWISQYIHRLQKESASNASRLKLMEKTNPRYVLRNYMAQLAIDAADKGDYSIIKELETMLKMPYTIQEEYEKWYAKRPEWARHKAGCSMLSCSS